MSKDTPDNQGDAYRPVSCDFYDVLESAATLRKPVPIVQQDAGGATTTRTARITNVFSKDGVEYITLDSGENIRLDALAAVDGVAANEFDQGTSAM